MERVKCETHDWQPTGKSALHVDFTYLREDGRHDRCVVPANYVRCGTCKQVGFRKPHANVVYTWGQ